MANTIRNFIAGRMNKVVDERLVPDGEYIDALNIRLGSTEASEVGSVENSKGNDRLTTLEYIDGTPLSDKATCIGAYADGEQETMYWFIHDGFFPVGNAKKLDLIVSYNTATLTLTYHVISINDGGDVNTTLNFSSENLITGINLIDNLLFFTDDLNQPRRINVNKNYADPIGNIDVFSAYDILVIKAPPISAPIMLPLNIAGEENYLEDRLISFGYRYKYEDNEYSAISQFSAPSFIPEQYNLSNESYLNEGMTNSTNACEVTYNSGGPLVVGIDILFKEMTSDIIKVIEKIDKANDGLSDNTPYTITFSNSKIFTVLPSSEILRLYDNVPLLAKAQTVMGNRLMYGNYVDGWDLKRRSSPTQFDYSARLISEDVGFEELSSTRSSSNYNFGNSNSIPLSQLNLDLTNAVGKLKIGATIDLDLSFTHYEFNGEVPSGVTEPPIEESTDRQLNFLYTLTQDYDSVTELYQSVDFQEKIGTTNSILPVYAASGETSCDGFTLTDLFNCTITDSLQGGNPTPMYKYASGIFSAGESVKTTHDFGTNIIGLQFPAMQFVDDVSVPPSPTTAQVFEYYSVTVRNATFSALGSPKSLHSNRGYEIGIVYMDEFNRATTALVSSNNTVHVGCSNSSSKNKIRVTIPPQQVAPDFAKRYKFVIKPDEASYNTVYTSIFFYDTVTASDYFLLQGENAAKVEEGDRFIVKRDVDGPLNKCTYATVLEKKAQEAGWILPTDSTGAVIAVPQGVYMQMRNSNFNSSLTDNAALISNESKYCATSSGTFVKSTNFFSANTAAAVNGIYPVIDIPSGSSIRLRFTFERNGTYSGDSSCERRIYKFDKTYISSATYNNIIDWWNGDNIGETIDDGDQEVGGDGAPIENEYVTPTATSSNSYYGLYNMANVETNYYRWFLSTATNEIRLAITGTRACGGNDNKKSCINSRITVLRAENTIVFETEPVDALPDVWYESSESYSIDTVGNHSGNVTNQNIASDISGVVDTAFFNCFSFGNGVESYKIRDSMSGRALALGNRVTTVAAQDFKRADRYADMTYSGVFNNEFNLNKLNEFNLGLANYKTLEESFGPIEKMFSQETNILILQEDKISYVLASKNLISDSVGGGVVASIPEILGTQIARVEEFGISNNPESFAQWGPSKYFTDAKRGAVIQLTGSGPSESLIVVSEAGMRSWFRDMFISNFTSQKLGGYDPYMNEYVLGNNLTSLPEEVSCISCGITKSYAISDSKSLSVCYSLGETVGEVTISWGTPLVSTSFSFSYTYNGIQYTQSPTSASGSITLDKDVVIAEQLDIVFAAQGGPATVNFTVSCPNADSINIVLVTLTNNSDEGKLIHNKYRWTGGGFVSPTHSNLITFLTSTDVNVVSQYTTITGPQGAGIIPADAAQVYLISDKQSTDDFDLDVSTDRFLWFKSSTLYTSSATDIAALLAAAIAASQSLTPVGPTPTFSASFTMPAVSNDDYLYLIWNYAAATGVDLCHSPKSGGSIEDACCDCTCSASVCTSWLVNNTTNLQVVLQYTACGDTKTSITLGANNSITICAESVITIVSGPTTGVNFTITECDCT